MRSANEIKAVFFDCDGLLVDSETLGMVVAQQVCDEFGITLDEGELKTFIGVRDPEWYAGLLRKKGLDIDVSEAVARQLELHIKGLHKVESFPGATQLPLRLKEEGIPMTLVSGSIRPQIQVVLQRLKFEELFKVVVTGDDTDPKSKPDPYPYQLALSQLNTQEGTDIQPSQVIVLEDTRSGIISALAAGMHVIGVKNAGAQDISEATKVIDTLEDLIGLPLDEWLKDEI